MMCQHVSVFRQLFNKRSLFYCYLSTWEEHSFFFYIKLGIENGLILFILVLTTTFWGSYCH